MTPISKNSILPISQSEAESSLPRFYKIEASVQTPAGLIAKRFFTDTESFNPCLIRRLSASHNLPLLTKCFQGNNPSHDPQHMAERRPDWFGAAVRYRLIEHFSTPTCVASPKISFVPIDAPMVTERGQLEIDCFGTTLVEIPNAQNGPQA